MCVFTRGLRLLLVDGVRDHDSNRRGLALLDRLELALLDLALLRSWTLGAGGGALLAGCFLARGRLDNGLFLVSFFFFNDLLILPEFAVELK